MPRYEVLVGNIGTVYSGENAAQAEADYLSYRTDSRRRYGRAAGEPVTLFKDGEIVTEYPGDSAEDWEEA